MNKKLVLSSIALSLLLAGCSDSDSETAVVTPEPEPPTEPTPEPMPTTQAMFSKGQEVLTDNKALLESLQTPALAAFASSEITAPAKNIILFVGDGMGGSTVTASRIRDGELRNVDGEENFLAFEKPYTSGEKDNFPFVAFSKTYTTDFQVPDSAGTMTAMMTGVKTRSGVLNTEETVVRGDCAAAANNALVPALALAEIAGKSTGVVSTARITHATPAATYAVSPDRNFENELDGDKNPLPAGCGDIAYQLLNFGGVLDPSKVIGPIRDFDARIDGLEVMLGGGKRHFVTVNGQREDDRNLIAEWQQKAEDDNKNWQFVENQQELAPVYGAGVDKLLGLFSSSHMAYEADRSGTGQPSLAEMTDKALDVLSTNEKGFFLMVESGRIDHAHHSGNAYRALSETIAFSDAIKTALDKLEAAGELDDTLILVTADHGHTLTIAGYPKRGNPILGKSVKVGTESELNVDVNDKPYTTLGYINGGGFGFESDEDVSLDTLDRRSGFRSIGRKDISSFDTTAKNFFQEALVKTGKPGEYTSETHTGEDVAIYARGPMAEKLQGTLEQNVIFHVMNEAGKLQEKAQAVWDEHQEEMEATLEPEKKI
ncbi:MAG: alkaline phosphatase [Endozoicomonas sp.]